MAKLVGDELPHDLLRRLRGDNLENYADKVILISTVDERGWAHPAMLSYFEIVAKDRCNIRLATYKDSSTTSNMRRNSKATLSIIDERVAYYIKGSVNELRREMKCTPFNAKLNLRVEQVLEDKADEKYEAGAYVAGGVTYRNPNRAAEMMKAKEVLAELLEEEAA